MRGLFFILLHLAGLCPGDVPGKPALYCGGQHRGLGGLLGGVEEGEILVGIYCVRED